MNNRGGFVIFSIVMLVFVSCGGAQNSGKTSWSPTELQGDYSYTHQGDTITLQLKADGDSLSGPLIYSFLEKDRNQGTFQGVIKDSLLMGTYRFQSEGMYSSRQTVFQISPEGLLEGFGEVRHQDATAVFVDPENLRFDHGMLLEKEH